MSFVDGSCLQSQRKACVSLECSQAYVCSSMAKFLYRCLCTWDSNTVTLWDGSIVFLVRRKGWGKGEGAMVGPVSVSSLITH